MNRYEIRTSQKKESIVNAAMRLFNQNGYSNTSIKAIAALAQVSQVSIYNYYGSKEGLVAECAKIILNETLEKSKDILNSNLSYVDKIMKAFQLCTTESSFTIEQCLSEIALTDPAFTTIFLREINTLKQSVYCMYIEEGKKNGCINPTLSTKLILKLIESYNNIPLDPAHWEEDITIIQRILLYGIIEP